MKIVVTPYLPAVALIFALTGCTAGTASETERSTEDGGAEASVLESAAPAVPLSAGCTSAFEDASDESSAGGWTETALAATLDQCASREEWLAAAISLPNAIGLTRADKDDAQQFLDLLCGNYPSGICVG